MAHPGEIKIHNVLQSFVDAGSLAGAVTAVADQDNILALNCVGWADIEARRPMQPDTMFWIASQTKPMTAAALMMLVEEDKLSLDDPVDKFIPDFKSVMVYVEKTDTQWTAKKATATMTVRHLLSHTAGLPFYTAVENPTLDGLPLATAVRSYASTPLNAEPGTVYSYSNAGTNTVGRLIELLSGMSYQQFMQVRLFSPLGMTDTTFFPTTQQIARLAKTYKPNAEKNAIELGTIFQLQYPLDQHATRYPMPAGGLFGTVTDCVNFCQMILSGGTHRGRRYLTPESIAEMTRRQTPPQDKNAYGLCWGIDDEGFGHGGAFGTDMKIYTGPKLAAVYMVQHNGFTNNGGEAIKLFKSTAVEIFAQPASRT